MIIENKWVKKAGGHAVYIQQVIAVSFDEEALWQLVDSMCGHNNTFVFYVDHNLENEDMRHIKMTGLPKLLADAGEAQK